MDGLDGELEVRDYALERQIMLSDGVFAIAMTLLALELKAPQGWDHTLPGLLSAGWPMFFSYGMSFFGIAIFWATHRQSYGRFLKSDFWITTFGILLLGSVTMIPFATRLYSEEMARREPLEGALWFYLGTFWITSFFNAVTWGYASLKPGIMHSSMGPRARAAVFVLSLTATPLMVSLGTLVGVLHQMWMLGLFAVMGVGFGALRRWAAEADLRARR